VKTLLPQKASFRADPAAAEFHSNENQSGINTMMRLVLSHRYGAEARKNGFCSSRVTPVVAELLLSAFTPQ